MHTLIGIDLAKSVFHVHAIDERGGKLFQKKLSRKQLLVFAATQPKSIMAMESCASSHFWARKFREQGHEVRIVQPRFVQAFLKSNKNDRNDAEAIAEAASRPSPLGLVAKALLAFAGSKGTLASCSLLNNFA